MLEPVSLPEELINLIGSETKDFAVKGRHVQPVTNSVGLIIFGLVWLAVTSIFLTVFLSPLVRSKDGNFTSGGSTVAGSHGNPEDIIVPAIIIGIFVLAGVVMLAIGLSQIIKKGGYFVGTPTRLISFNKGRYRSVDWEQFSGDIEVRGKDQKGTISLVLRTGKMVSGKNGPSRYVPDMFYLPGIPGIFEIEQICRKRIKENDPTPLVS